MSSFAKEKEALHELYGLVFPDGLFHLHNFFSAMPKAEREALGMSPSGLLEVVALSARKRAALRPTHPLLLHYRFYRDPPEFFSCLHGQSDGEHWGILLDEP